MNKQRITDGQGLHIPSKYKDRVSRGFEAPEAHRLRILLSGLVGHGKTWWLSSIPDSLILDVENKASHVPNPKAARVHLPTGADYDTLIDELIADGLAGKAPFKTISFDTLDSYVQIQRTQLSLDEEEEDIVRQGKHGAGWERLNQPIIRQLQSLYDAGYGLVVNSHCILKEGDYVLSIKPAMQAYVFAQCEYAAQVERIMEKEVPRKNRDGSPMLSKGGKPITRMKTLKHPQYQLNLSANTHIAQSSQEHLIDSRVHIPLVRETIPFGPDDGWARFVEEYNRGVAAIRSEVAKTKGTD